jgi:HlyD family secretion protein
MDIPRKSRKVRRIVIRVVMAVVALAAIAVITLGLSRLEPAAPSVERQTLLIDGVKRGEIVVQAGTPVEPNTIILVLSNPQLELSWEDAQSELNSAKAQYNVAQARHLSDQLRLEAGIARTRADVNDAQLTFEVDKKQHEDGLISELRMKLSESNVEQRKKQLEVEERQYDVWLNQTKPAEMVLAKASLERAQSQYNLRKEEHESLKVRAGAKGVLAPIEQPIELGQQIGQGQLVAKVTDPNKLMARLQIPQGQARDVKIGLPAEIDTYNGVVSGRVSRIEPTVMEGNVTVDVSLEGELPKGSRPDLSVVGTVEIEQLLDILYVGRPVLASADSRVELFKLIEGGRFAARVPVQFGKTSVSTIEVLDGLVVGDEIILSDVSQWDTVDKIRLK